jgi:hypothetical protein
MGLDSDEKVVEKPLTTTARPNGVRFRGPYFQTIGERTSLARAVDALSGSRDEARDAPEQSDGRQKPETRGVLGEPAQILVRRECREHDRGSTSGHADEKDGPLKITVVAMHLCENLR